MTKGGIDPHHILSELNVFRRSKDRAAESDAESVISRRSSRSRTSRKYDSECECTNIIIPGW